MSQPPDRNSQVMGTPAARFLPKCTKNVLTRIEFDGPERRILCYPMLSVFVQSCRCKVTLNFLVRRSNGSRGRGKPKPVSTRLRKTWVGRTPNVAVRAPPTMQSSGDPPKTEEPPTRRPPPLDPLAGSSQAPSARGMQTPVSTPKPGSPLAQTRSLMTPKVHSEAMRPSW